VGRLARQGTGPAAGRTRDRVRRRRSVLRRRRRDLDSAKAQGLDGALRKLATTPLGLWLLVAAALGLVTFGIYSWCDARWREIQPR